MKTFLKILVLPYVALFAVFGAAIVCFSKMYDDYVDEVVQNYLKRFWIWFNILFWPFYAPGSGYYGKVDHKSGMVGDFVWFWKKPRKADRWQDASSWRFINHK